MVAVAPPEHAISQAVVLLKRVITVFAKMVVLRFLMKVPTVPIV